MSTSPLTVLFDGDCRFCGRSAIVIRRWFGKGRVTLCDFQQPGALEKHPGIRRDALMKKMHVVMPDGRVFAGAEAFARILASVPFVGWIGFLYYVPGVRNLAEATYSFIAKHRYRLGRDACDGGTCRLHGM